MRWTEWMSCIASICASGAVHAQEPARLVQLRTDDLRETLVGKHVSYNPPRSFDMAISEEFLPDGRWGGIKYGRGPLPFSGRWSIRRSRICVVAEPKTRFARYHRGRYCRVVWKDPASGQLQMDYLEDWSRTSAVGLQQLTIRDLPKAKGPGTGNMPMPR